MINKTVQIATTIQPMSPKQSRYNTPLINTKMRLFQQHHQEKLLNLKIIHLTINKSQFPSIQLRVDE